MALVPMPTQQVSQPALPRTLLSPRLLWAQGWDAVSDETPTSDLPAFPDIHERRLRKKPDRKLLSVEFQVAVRRAQRVLILDPHFDFKHGVQPLCDALCYSSAMLVRINTRGTDEDLKIHAELNVLREVLQDKAGASTLVEVEIRHNAVLLPMNSGDLELHDRFAIVDDELWHFGATCGGAHPTLTAHSRGWDVAATAAEAYFADLWGRP